MCSIISKLFILLYFISIVSCSILFNSAAPCILNIKICYFFETQNWDGGIVPSINDSVVVISQDNDFILVIDRETSVRDITLQGKVTLYLVHSSLTVSEGLWTDDSVTIFANNSTLLTSTFSIYSTILHNSLLKTFSQNNTYNEMTSFSSIKNIICEKCKLAVENKILQIKNGSQVNLEIGNGATIVVENHDINSQPQVSFGTVTQKEGSQVMINVAENTLSLNSPTNLTGYLFVESTATLIVNNTLSISSSIYPSICPVICAGTVIFGPFADLQCKGKLYLSSVEVDGNMTVDLLEVDKLNINTTYTHFIFGALIVNEISFYYNSLTVVGNYIQMEGNLNIRLNETSQTKPVIRVEGNIEINELEVTIEIDNGFEDKLLLFESTGKISAYFSTVKELNMTHNLHFDISETQIFVWPEARKPELVWILQNYYIIIVVAILLGIAAFVITMIIKREQREKKRHAANLALVVSNPKDL